MTTLLILIIVLALISADGILLAMLDAVDDSQRNNRKLFTILAELRLHDTWLEARLKQAEAEIAENARRMAEGIADWSEE